MFRGLWGLSSLEVSRGLYASMSFTDLEDPSSHSSLTGWVLRTCGLCGSGWPGTWNRARSRPGHGRGGGGYWRNWHSPKFQELAYTNVHIPPEESAREIWTALPGLWGGGGGWPGSHDWMPSWLRKPGTLAHGKSIGD